ncbi:unnamed protein product [Eruca vesicaria subsp. sativa]|uniref:glutamate decarboxylase n=1 Tax=Eruca vesicaria subsp. sativa TaxID=29727 RepID=A0ABC8JPX4_ERUVS|nr:unnamed protein product [Eruca vesicaria subsp. sativa]
MIARLFNAPLGDTETAMGVGTVGSSEAIMLAGSAFKRNWQNKSKAECEPYDKPNIVTRSNVQVCWENTICVAAILGSTLTGEFEDIKRLNDLLVKKNEDTGWNTPIHVDATSGGFISLFIYPELEWDFRLPLVKSINGYKNVMENCRENMLVLRERIEKTERFNIVSKDVGVPLVAFSLKGQSFHNEFEISEMLRRFGWIVPAYIMPADAQHITVLRVVIREDFSRTLAERLVADILKVLS